LNVNSFVSQVVDLEIYDPKVVAYKQQMQVLPGVEVPLVLDCFDLKRSVDAVIPFNTLLQLTNHYCGLCAPSSLALLIVVEELNQRIFHLYCAAEY